MLSGLLIASFLLAGLVFGVPFFWRARKILVLLVGMLNIFASFGLLASRLDIYSGLLALVSLYVAFNVLRVYEERMNASYLLATTRRSGFLLNTFQIFIGLMWIGWERVGPNPSHLHWLALIWLLLILISSFVIFISLLLNIVRSRPLNITDDYVVQLPTLSVCVPARNETDDLRACLESLVASDYPKLEIIVLDDCSQTRRTPEVIRDFAQHGVQFVAGTEPASHWLAKNWAYEQLLNAANGELVLFCGVDTRFTSDSLRKIVRELKASHSSMLSVLPARLDRQYFSLIQPMRYLWELALPRFQFKRPPVLSTCWIARRNKLIKFGGFSGVTRQIVPEAYFARKFASQQRYKFVRSLEILGISSRKSVSEQRATALRTRYPQLHRRPEWVFVLSMTELAILIAPFGFLVYGLIARDHLFIAISVVATALLIGAYEIMIMAIISPNALFSLISFPFVVLGDIVMLHLSMYRYEFSVVEWKNRNVCIPAMHVYSSLPLSENKANRSNHLQSES